ncbi:MAG: leucine-rich repeat protein [Solobacterium sp.]|nr:leucine-rich repeat protein [Solobacterium sp.]
MTDNNEFVINEDGILINYTGNDTEIVVPDGVKIIGSAPFSAMKGYQAVEKLIIPEGVTEIQANALSYSNIREIVLPSTLKIIGDYAFANCKNLKSVTIPEGVTEIRKSVFENSGLEEIHLPGSLTVIADDAFCDCSDLKKFDIPRIDSLEIGRNAFLGCKGLCDEYGRMILYNRLCCFNANWKENDIYVELPDHVTAVEDGVFGTSTFFHRFHITMSLNCPSWRVREAEEPEEYPASIIKDHLSTLSFRNRDGRIVARVMLATITESEPVRKDCIRSIRCLPSGGFDFAAYDSMFSRLEDEDNKTMMALDRLRYPYGLSEERKEAYTSYLKKNSYVIYRRFKANESPAYEMNFRQVFELLLKWKALNAEVVPELIKYAQEKEEHGFLMELLDYQHNESGRTDVYQTMMLKDEDDS